MDNSASDNTDASQHLPQESPAPVTAENTADVHPDLQRSIDDNDPSQLDINNNKANKQKSMKFFGVLSLILGSLSILVCLFLFLFFNSISDLDGASYAASAMAPAMIGGPVLILCPFLSIALTSISVNIGTKNKIKEKTPYTLAIIGAIMSFATLVVCFSVIMANVSGAQ